MKKKITMAMALALAANIMIAPGSWADSEKTRTLTYKVRYEQKLDTEDMPWAQKVMILNNAVISEVTIKESESGLELVVGEELKNGLSRSEIYVFEGTGQSKWKSVANVARNQKGEEVRCEKMETDAGLFQYPEGILPAPYGFHVLFRDDVGAKGFKKQVLLMTTPTIISRAMIKVEETVTVDVPAGSFECRHVLIEPNANDFFGDIVGTLIQPFVPKYELWVEKASPHRIVKYKGVLGEMPTTANIWEIRELVK